MSAPTAIVQRIAGRSVARSISVWLVAATVVSSPSFADWQPDSSDKRQRSAAEAIAKIKTKKPALNSYFDQAYGYAILPGVTRGAVGFGGAYGRGLVIEGDRLVGRTGFSQISSGIQIGVKHFSMVIFFKDRDALEDYQNGRLRFLGQAGIDLLTVGVSSAPAYDDGVAIFAINKLGLMAELSYSGARFSYQAIDEGG
jgi:lipid-binding SYLF domain-containing protein